jgi:hypothetical protein
VATALTDVSVAELERHLDDLQAHEPPEQRTSVLTHMAWVPPEWSRHADRVLDGLGARIPSRTLILHPDPKAKSDRIDAEIEHECFPAEGTKVCAEVVHLWLRGSTAKAPASVVVPLQLPDLPVFLRWRGKPAFGRPELEQLIGVADRLIVDSSEWSGLPGAYSRLAELFDRTVVSDLAWARVQRWCAGLADCWPDLRGAKKLKITGPQAEALLLAGWLRSRLKSKVALQRRDARTLSHVEVDGVVIRPPKLPLGSASDLLSDQLELYERSPVYEAAVRAV